MGLKHVHDLPPPFDSLAPPVEVHPAVAALVMRLLAKRPADRPASAVQVAEECLRLQGLVAVASTAIADGPAPPPAGDPYAETAWAEPPPAGAARGIAKSGRPGRPAAHGHATVQNASGWFRCT